MTAVEQLESKGHKLLEAFSSPSRDDATYDKLKACIMFTLAFTDPDEANQENVKQGLDSLNDIKSRFPSKPVEYSNLAPEAWDEVNTVLHELDGTLPEIQD